MKVLSIAGVRHISNCRASVPRRVGCRADPYSDYESGISSLSGTAVCPDARLAIKRISWSSVGTRGLAFDIAARNFSTNPRILLKWEFHGLLCGNRAVV